MSVEVKTWKGERRRELAEMFAAAFAQDQALVSLVGGYSDDVVRRLVIWFEATLQTWPKSQVLVAMRDDIFVGGNIVSLGNEPPKPQFLLMWFLRQALAFGFSVPWRIMQHEKLRMEKYPHSADLVIEFVAVDAAARGQGLARRLFEAAYARLSTPASIALETGNPQNVAIYNHMGYQERVRYIDEGVEYIVMTCSLAEER